MRRRLSLALIVMVPGAFAAEAPRVVATPPTYAVRDLCVTADGEIRHYGWQMAGGERRRVYISSRDEGRNWRTCLAEDGDVGAMVRSPYGGGWLYWRMGKGGVVQLVRSEVGPGDTCPETENYPWRNLELRQLLPMRSRRRWVAAFSDVTCASNECYHAVVALSDDDGRTWRRRNLKPVPGVRRLADGDKRPHWFNDGCEPSVAELKDGSLLLAVRTSGPHAAFYRSSDGGETWGEGVPDPAFWQANTMPYLFRLRDGRLLFIWNNTQMLPTRDASESPELDAATLRGVWESVFTNRDALHAAISEDDGRTWIGFREIILNPIRNAADFRQLGNDPAQEHDKSVHQTQAIELSDGKVLLALGQNIASRRLVVLDPEWLYETSRTDDFRHGLENLSTHLYVKSLSGGWRGWAGHCAWNRISGALMVREPDTGAKSVREALQLCRIPDPRLVSDRQGVVWNFPAAREGRLEVECRIEGSGFRLVLSDHWMNPCDEYNPPRSPVCRTVTAAELPPGGWHVLTCEWDADSVRFSADGRVFAERPLRAMPKFGLSYLHLQTLAEGLDARGTYFRSFSMRAKDETGRLQAQIDDVAARGGGRVVVPSGRHLTGQLDLRSNVELHLEEGAVLEGVAGLEHYRVTELPYSEGTWSAVVSAIGVTNVAITGRGTIFGNGTAWPQPADYGGNQEGRRPRGVFFADSRNIRLSDFTLRDSACWGVVFKCCEDVDVRRLRIDSHANANNDGIDLEARNVVIADCDIDTGDDAVCLKSNNPDFVVENVLVTNVTARSHCNALKLGTASHGTMRSVRFVDCRTEPPRRDFVDRRFGRDRRWYEEDPGRVKQYPGGVFGEASGSSAICIENVDGGVVEDVVCRKISAFGSRVPIFIRAGTRSGRSCGTPPSDKRVFRNIMLDDIVGESMSGVASSVTGVPGCRIGDVRLRNVRIVCRGCGDTQAERTRPVPEVAGKYPDAHMFGCMLPAYGLYVRHVDGLELSDVVFSLREGDRDCRESVVRDDVAEKLL